MNRRDGAATLLSPRDEGGRSATPPVDRRAFLESATRTALLGALGGLAIVLVARRQLCTNRGVCRTCSAYDGCELPQREKRR